MYCHILEIKNKKSFIMVRCTVESFSQSCFDLKLKDDSLAWKCSYIPKKKDLYRREGKGRRCCLGAEFIQFLVAQVFCTRLIWRKGWGAKQLARQGIECILSSKEQRRPLLSLLYNFFFYNSMVMTDQETRLRRRLHLSIDWYSFYDQKVSIGQLS